MAWYEILSIVVSVVVSILSLLGFGTVMKFYWEDKHKKKEEQSEECKKRQKDERHKEIIDAVSEFFNPYAKKVMDSIEQFNNRLDRAEQCDRAILRNSLMDIYYKCHEKGYRTEDDSKNYREMHEAYHEIGGNSFIDSDVSEWFNNLPLKPNDYQGTKAKKTTTAKKQPGKKKEVKDNE